MHFHLLSGSLPNRLLSISGCFAGIYQCFRKTLPSLNTQSLTVTG
jgi:hypothetical protein